MKTKILLLAVPAVVILQSCMSNKSFTARKYMPGTYVDNIGKVNTGQAAIPHKAEATMIPKQAFVDPVTDTSVVAVSPVQSIERQESKPVTVASNKTRNESFGKILLNKKGALIPTILTMWKGNNDKASVCAATEQDIPRRVSGMAVASLIFGILALVAWYGAFLFGILAIVFGIIALGNISAYPDVLYGRRMAMVGIILGIIALIIWTAVILSISAAIVAR
jgi:hypothetical protein